MTVSDELKLFLTAVFLVIKALLNLGIAMLAIMAATAMYAITSIDIKPFLFDNIFLIFSFTPLAKISI